MCLFAKNAFLEWKRIEKKRKGRTFVKKKSNNKESKHNERTHEERTNQEEEEEVKRKNKENQSF